jgi:hypothetical protein
MWFFSAPLASGSCPVCVAPLPLKCSCRVNEPLDVWFAHEVLGHDAALLRYLRRVWSAKHEVHDLRQDAYFRVYEAAGARDRIRRNRFYLPVTHSEPQRDHSSGTLRFRTCILEITYASRCSPELFRLEEAADTMQCVVTV